MFDFIYIPFEYLMKFCLMISNNHYIFALFFFALFMQIILLPLAIKQQKSQIKMAQIRPKEMAIREKYKGRTDRVTQQKMNMEIQEMYQENGYSQFSGCLPLLIQLPIILILFTIVREPLTYASDIEGFDVKKESQVAVEFYQAEKEAVIKSAFSDDEYEEFIEEIEKNQKDLGGKDTDKDVEGTSISIFEYSEDNATEYPEMVLSSLIIEGKSEIQELVDEGKLDKSILQKYTDTHFEEYAGQMPKYQIGSVNLIKTPSLKGDYWLLLIPVLVFLTSFLSTKLSRKFSGSAQQTDANGNPIGGGLFMEVGMPLMSAMFTFMFSSAVGCYWIWRTLVSMVQTLILAKAMPIPKVTEEQIAEARKELKATQNNKKKKVITIEVDEDDNSYDEMIVKNPQKSSSKRASDPTQRTPRHIEMLTADDEDEIPSKSSNDESEG